MSRFNGLPKGSGSFPRHLAIRQTPSRGVPLPDESHLRKHSISESNGGVGTVGEYGYPHDGRADNAAYNGVVSTTGKSKSESE